MKIEEDEAQVLSYRLKEPFTIFLNQGRLLFSRIAETTLELYEFIINNLESVNKFNEDMDMYLEGKMAFQQPQYLNVML